MDNLKQIIASSRYSYKDFSKHIATMLDKEWSEKFYQRQYQILKGDVRANDQEKEAYDYWVQILRDPFEVAAPSFRYKSFGKKLNLIMQWINTGIYNKPKARNMIKDMIRTIQ